MPRHAYLIIFALTLSMKSWSAFAGSTTTPSIQGPQGTMVVERRAPLQSKTCVRENDHGECKEWDYKYSVAGASCTAECVSFGSFDQCRLRNRCEFDERSGCFRKKTCVEVGDFGKCKVWEEGVACD